MVGHARKRQGFYSFFNYIENKSTLSKSLFKNSCLPVQAGAAILLCFWVRFFVPKPWQTTSKTCVFHVKPHAKGCNLACR
jgi:hypothetical protein